ncbi:hypothetical protein MLD38_015506 [Melastoma candidum]|uniref:Uncharacterized protein n=1 Tax=Melastoma candidum TaxID=119954 RepID=A0ACB9RFM1_9MYRT|nr:hypothetical protein MLD38_015506 [Melastoma candidum]
MAAIPDEILSDILSRLPVKTLSRFKSVSRSWLSLISSPGFVKDHLRRALAGTPSTRVLTANPFKSIDCETLEEIIDLDVGLRVGDNEWVHLLASHDGLIVLAVMKDDVLPEGGDIYLWNPATGLFRQLPKPALDLSPCYYELGFDSKIDDYKVLRHGCCFDSRDNVELVFEVLPLRANAWRQVSREPLFDGPVSAGVFLNKAIHWINTTGRIVAFDLENENFMGFPPLPVNGKSIFCHRLSVHLGCLVTCHRYIDSPFQAWIMEEYGVESSWTKLFDITLDNFPIHDYYPYITLIAIARRGKAAVVRYQSSLFLYDMQKETYEQLPVEGHPVWPEAKAYVQTLVSPLTEGFLD